MKWKDFEKNGKIKLDDLADFYNEKSKLYKTTQGFQQIHNYVLDQVLSEAFQNRITEIRKKYSVPEFGYEYPGSEVMDETYKPAGRFVSPSDWSPKNYKDLSDEVKELARSWKLHPNGWHEFFMNYIIYDQIIFPDYPEMNLCFVEQVEEDIEELAEWKQDNDANFPINLRISPYASKRVILDYIEKLYATEIYPLQSVRKINEPSDLGKKRTKKTEVQNRDNLIWQLHQKGCTTQEILIQLIQILGDSPDEAALRKIISLQKEKRT